MKKLILPIYLLIICTSVMASEDKFINALRNCSAYTDSGTINADGINAKSDKQMSGWQNGKCTYKETLTIGENKITTSCSFSKPQIKEIVSVADAYYLTQKYSKEQLDLTSSEAVKNNPVVQVLNKYLQDPEVCNISGF